MTNNGFEGLLAELDDEEGTLEEGRSGATYWKPTKKGDELVGKLIKVTTGHGEYGESPVLNVQRPDGEKVAAWVFHSVLDAEIREKRPAPGAKIAIRYLGEREGRSGNSYKVYRVATDERLDGFGDYYDDARTVKKKVADPDETPF